MFSFGIDIGGMSIKIGLVDEYGKIVEKRVIKTVTDQNLAIKNMAEQIQDILKTQNITIKDIKGIGLGCPGAVDGSSGIIDVLPNLGWENVPIVEKLNEYFNVKKGYRYRSRNCKLSCLCQGQGHCAFRAFCRGCRR